MEIWQEIAFKNISDTLSQSGLSQAAFARKVKVNPNHLNMVINGKRPVTRQLVATISENLGIERNWFYTNHSLAPEPGIDQRIEAAIERGAEKALSSHIAGKAAGTFSEHRLTEAQLELIGHMNEIEKENPKAYAILNSFLKDHGTKFISDVVTEVERLAGEVARGAKPSADRKLK